MPDSRSNILPTFDQLDKAYNVLRNLLEEGTTFVHCYAAIERSPMLCILYIMKSYKLGLEEALDYVCRQHKYANPTNYQLKTINKFKKKLDN